MLHDENLVDIDSRLSQSRRIKQIRRGHPENPSSLLDDRLHQRDQQLQLSHPRVSRNDFDQAAARPASARQNIVQFTIPRGDTVKALTSHIAATPEVWVAVQQLIDSCPGGSPAVAGDIVECLANIGLWLSDRISENSHF